MDVRQALLARMYPGLKPSLSRYDIRDGERMEYYPLGETDSPNPKHRVIEAPRGTSIPDLAGEIVSHDLAQGGDQRLTAAYGAFQRSMTPEQQRALQEQYAWAQENDGETRPFEEWRKQSGQPAYFRGNLFGQWPDEFYTQGQRDTFDKLRNALRNLNPAR